MIKLTFSFLLLFSAHLFSRELNFSEVNFILPKLSAVEAKNVRAYLALMSEPRSDRLNSYQANVIKQTALALQVFGYYEPIIDVELEPEQKNLNVLINVELGPRIKLGSVALTIVGDANEQLEFQQLLKNTTLKTNSFLSHQEYKEFKNTLLSMAQKFGYFDGELITHNIEIDIASQLANITLVYDSKIRYKFGQRVITNKRKAGAIVDEVITFNVGDDYDESLLNSYQVDLLNSKYFKSVVVRPDIVNRSNGQVPVLIQVLNHPSNTYEVGLGYVSDVGVRGKVNWQKPWLNDQGHRLNASIEFSRVQQEYTLGYDIPIEDPTINFVTISAGYQHKDNADTKSDLYTLQFQRQFEISHQWLRTWFIKWEREIFTQGSQDDQTLMVLPGISFAKTLKKGGLDPYWGYKHLASFEMASPIWGADINMAKIQGYTKYLTSFQNQHFITARLGLGAIEVDDIRHVPASLRFFAGGSQSIRGFGFEKVTAIDDEGKYQGAQYLTTASIEYGYRIFEHWRSSLFVDAGTATNDFSEQISVGVGNGLRWLTPIGPIKLDFAVPVQGRTDDDFTIHLFVGPEL